ncbi:MAG: phosphatidate cytidylyltransferase [Bacteroidetes bacterium]|nr:phosphatidate cytidylyltransferase [Bacteroidota bacterium]
MTNFWQRAITGTIFVVVLVGAILLGGWYMHVTFGLVVLFGLLEFYKLFEKTETKPQRVIGTLIGSLLYFSVILIDQGSTKLFIAVTLGILLTSLILISVVELFRSTKKPFENIALTYTGIFYLVIPFLLLNILADKPRMTDSSYNFWPVLSIFILIWCNDTFAYLTGRLIGKHKLFERISPKKTWEGFIGGAVFAMIAGILLAYFLDQSYVKFIAYALVASVIGTLGDLVESMLKRSVDVKDSGTILPGHGGILDRFDAVLFVVPVIFFLEKFIFAFTLD